MRRFPSCFRWRHSEPLSLSPHVSHWLAPCLLAPATVGVFALPAHAQRGDVGTLSVTRQVDVTPGTLAEAARYVAARPNQTVFVGQGVRTLKRSQAEIRFFDKSALRINERTDLVVQEADNLRRIRLSAGAVWVKVAKGIRTQVETPTVTAAAKGTEFVVALVPDSRPQPRGRRKKPVLITEIVVLEGVVEVTAGGKTVDVGAGQSVSFGEGFALESPRGIPRNEMPREYGGLATSWWSQIGANNELTSGTSPRSTPGTGAQQLLRDSPVTEIATLSGSNPVATGGTGGSGTGGVGGIIRSEKISRQVRPNLPPTLIELRQIDRTQTSYLTLFAGIGAALAADSRDLSVAESDARGTLFALTKFPEKFGARSELSATIGRSRYSLESNYRLVNNPNDNGDDHIFRADSVALVERPVGRDLTIFAGRRRFFYGPVFNNFAQTQLVADRYSGAGARLSSGPWAAEAAWLFDADPIVRGAQPGAVGTVSYRDYGVTASLNVLKNSGARSGTGRTFTLALPLAPNVVDGYAEIGRGVDGESLRTYGFYFPTFFQRTDLDVFVEYAKSGIFGESLSVIVAKENPNGVGGRVFANQSGSTWTGGVAAIWRFGAHSSGDTASRKSAITGVGGGN